MADQNHTPETISRQQAAACGLAHYFTGEPCVNGHTEKRSVKTRQCLACTREAMARIRAADPARIERATRAPKPVEPERIVARQHAIAAGLPRYFTGIPCVNGHISERTTRGKLCLACHRQRAAQRRATQGPLVAAIKARSYAANRESVKAKVTAYTKANIEKVRARRKKHREANKEAIAERMKVWAAANRPILRQHERNRRARERGAEGTHTAAEIAALAKRQGYRCAHDWCRVSIRKGWHVDHVIPLARGGSNWIANIALLCAPCNQAKHDHDPIEWAQQNGRLL